MPLSEFHHEVVCAEQVGGARQHCGFARADLYEILRFGKHLDQFSGHRPQQDDITVLIVERHDQFTPLARISLAVATALVAGAAALAWSLA